MKFFNIYLTALTISNVLFLYLNRKFIWTISRRMTTAAEAAEICVAQGPTKLVIQGHLMGLLEVQNKRLVSIQKTTLDGGVAISLNKKCKYVLSTNKNLSYGDMVILMGTIDIIKDMFIIHDIETITIGDKNLIAKYFNKQYSISSLIALVITLVVNYFI